MADEKNGMMNAETTTKTNSSRKRANSSRDSEAFNQPHVAGELETVSDVSAPRSGSLSREDIVNNLKDYAKQYGGKARETAENVRRQAGELAKRFEDVPVKSREVLQRVDSGARANPWFSIAVTGAGALALGFLAGKLFARASDRAYGAVGEAGIDLDQPIDE